MRLRLILIAALVLLIPAGALAQAEPDWSNPDNIGPLDSDLGAFLDADFSALQQTADAAYKAGDFEKSARYLLALIRQGPRDAAPIYSLACCYGLLGNAELAGKYLRRAVAAGFSDLGWASWDPDFENVRGQAAFDSAFTELQEEAAARDAGLGSQSWFDAPALLRCRILLPDGYDAGQSYPLVVGLHGYGASPENFARLWERFPRHNFIFAIPQAPYAQVEGKDLGYSWSPPLPDEDAQSGAAREMTEQYITSVAGRLSEQYKPSAVYLMGFSQGCAFTYGIGIRNHELFDGLICCGGWLDEEWITADALTAAKELRVIIVQGLKDRIVEPEAAEKASELLKQHGYDVTLFTFDGEHRVPPEATAAISDWLTLP